MNQVNLSTKTDNPFGEAVLLLWYGTDGPIDTLLRSEHRGGPFGEDYSHYLYLTLPSKNDAIAFVELAYDWLCQKEEQYDLAEIFKESALHAVEKTYAQ